MAEAAKFAKSQLKSLIERVERLEEEKKAIADDIKEVFAEAKACGFDTKAMRAVIKMRKTEPSERQEFEALVNLYREGVGMGPLFEAVQEKTQTAHIHQISERQSRRSGQQRGQEQ
jgi:uncharacterized protein (UPF0335 family)